MNAIVLAAGAGTRLPQSRFFGSKVLVPVQGRPLLEWNLLLLKRAGIRKVVVNLSSPGKKIRSFLKKKKFFGLSVVFSCEKELLGTAGGVKKAQPLLGNRDFLVLYGDNFCDFDLKKLIRFHRKNKPVATLGVFDPRKAKHSGILAGFVKVDRKGRVEKFVEKRNNRKIPKGSCINAGIGVFSPEIFQHIPARRVYDFAKDVFPTLVRAKRKIFARQGATYVLASDTPETLQRTRRIAARMFQGATCI